MKALLRKLNRGPIPKSLRKLSLVRTPNTESPLTQLISRPDIAVTNPAYLEVGKGVYVGPRVEMSTPAVAGFAHTKIIFEEASIISKNATLAISPGEVLRVGAHAKVGINAIVNGSVRLCNHSGIGPFVFATSGRRSTPPQYQYWLPRDIPEIVSRDPVRHFISCHPVYIGEDASIGTGAYISAGVHIGKGAWIGPNSLVTQDIEPYTIQMGLPCKLVNRRLNFDPPTRIEAREESHRPYFYEGFYGLQVDLAQSLPEGMIFAERETVAVLKGGSYSSLEIKGQLVHGATAAKLSLWFNEELLVSRPIRTQQFAFVEMLNERCFAAATKTKVPSVLRKRSYIRIKVESALETPKPIWGLTSLSLIEN